MTDYRNHAVTIWKAGVAAVQPQELIRRGVAVRRNSIDLYGSRIPLAAHSRICVVGEGKAAGSMAQGLEDALGPGPVDERLTGWANVPDQCVRTLRRIRLHAARPAGLNEPTVQAVEGTERILGMLQQLGNEDLAIVLLSGGGSALLCAPRPPATLEDKKTAVRWLMRAGASIQEINLVRRHLSRVKGGGLAAACRAGRLAALIISDVVGDRPEDIASGPTCPDPTTGREALGLLERYGATPPRVPHRVFDMLSSTRPSAPLPAHVENHVIARNRDALEASAAQAVQLGYRVVSLGSGHTGDAERQGRMLAEQCNRIHSDVARSGQPVCLLSGGETVVQFDPGVTAGKGGRNQQLALAALIEFEGSGCGTSILLSGGTDGEDGPTDAAGAFVDRMVMEKCRNQQLDPRTFLRRYDAYTFFERVDGLVRTGLTGTNVADIQVALIR